MLLADIVGPAKVGDRQRVLRGQLPVARTAALVAPQRLDGFTLLASRTSSRPFVT